MKAETLFLSVVIGVSCPLFAGCSTSGSPKQEHRALAADSASPGVNCAIKTGSVYSTVKIRPAAAAADQKKKIVKFYFTPQEREQHRIVISGGTVYDFNCQPFGNGPSGGAEANYVMDAAGNFYWFDENTNPQTRHSAVFDAGPVAGAGNITIVQSKITYIDSDSGHYPTGPVFDDVKTQLKDDGVDLDEVKVVDTQND